MTSWLAKHPGVVTEAFPGYAPDLNPDEDVWGWAKFGRLANLATRDKDELWHRVVDELVELTFRPDLLRGVHPPDRPSGRVTRRLNFSDPPP